MARGYRSIGHVTGTLTAPAGGLAHVVGKAETLLLMRLFYTASKLLSDIEYISLCFGTSRFFLAFPRLAE